MLLTYLQIVYFIINYYIPRVCFVFRPDDNSSQHINSKNNHSFPIKNIVLRLFNDTRKTQYSNIETTTKKFTKLDADTRYFNKCKKRNSMTQNFQCP